MAKINAFSAENPGRIDVSRALGSDATAMYIYDLAPGRMGFNPLTGALPTIAARMPAKISVRGSGTFTAQQQSSETSGPCQRVSATGAFKGTFHTRFAGWGARTVTFRAGDDARYYEDR